MNRVFARELLPASESESAISWVNTLYAEGGTDINGALETAPTFRQFVFSNLGGRMAEVITRMEEIAFRPVERRLASLLLSRADKSGTIQTTHQEIAVELGTAREVVSRHLKRFESSGLIELERSTVRVSKPEELRRVADTSA